MSSNLRTFAQSFESTKNKRSKHNVLMLMMSGANIAHGPRVHAHAPCIREKTEKEKAMLILGERYMILHDKEDLFFVRGIWADRLLYVLCSKDGLHIRAHRRRQ